MRILIHDFGGYPFPVQLSRELAHRGHSVLHVYCGSLKTTPGGDHISSPNDPESLQIESVELNKPLAKYSFVKRWRQEREYGRRITRLTKGYQPDIVVSANTPLDAQKRLLGHCRHEGIPFVFWLQDVLSIATDRLLRKKLPGAGRWIGGHYLRMEARMLRNSDQCLIITDAFESLLLDWGVASDRITVIENWAPIDQLPVGPKENEWSRQHGLHDKACAMYTGTMGMKHNPDLLLQLAIQLRQREDARVVVVSEGIGAEWLTQKAQEYALTNLVILPYGPFESVPKAMASADVLLAVLEPDAGVFSVPSKVLAYLCAARPLVLSIPTDNLAAKIVTAQKAGIAVSPEKADEFVKTAISLLDDADRRSAMGAAGRQYAETTFDIQEIANRFEAALPSTISHAR